MNKLRFVALVLALILASVSATAYHYTQYGSNTYESERSYSTESVNSYESEYHRSTSGCGYRYCHSIGSYDYGRTRSFSFSRTESYESERSTSNYNYPSYYGNYGYYDYNYPYYDVGTYYGSDYRPYDDYYSIRYSPYHANQYSRVGAYASRYNPYGY